MAEAKVEPSVTDLSNIPVCTIVTSRLETILKQTIAVNLVRETGYRVTELVEWIQKVSPNLDGKKVLNKISILVKIITALHNKQPESPDKAIEWDEKARKFPHLPDTENIKPDKFDEKELERASFVLSLLLDDVIVAFPTLDVFEVTENVAEKFQSTRADRLKAIEGLVAGLVLNIIRDKNFLFQDLVSEVTPFSPDTVVEALNHIHRMKEDVQNRDGNRFKDPQEMKEFTHSYTTCVEFYIKNFTCFPLLSEQVITRQILEIKPTAEEVMKFLTVYDTLIQGGSSEDMKTSNEVNWLAREQHSLWSAANSLIANLINTDSADCPGRENRETSRAESAENHLVEKYRVWFNSPGDDVSGDKWLDNSTRYYTLGEITDYSRHHTVTHLIVKDEIPQNVHSIFPQLTHLKLEHVKGGDYFLDRISQLGNLEILNMPWNIQSDNLPDDKFTSLQSLRELNISGCKLRTLPNRKYEDMFEEWYKTKEKDMLREHRHAKEMLEMRLKQEQEINVFQAFTKAQHYYSEKLDEIQANFLGETEENLQQTLEERKHLALAVFYREGRHHKYGGSEIWRKYEDMFEEWYKTKEKNMLREHRHVKEMQEMKLKQEQIERENENRLNEVETRENVTGEEPINALMLRRGQDVEQLFEESLNGEQSTTRSATSIQIQRSGYQRVYHHQRVRKLPSPASTCIIS